MKKKTDAYGVALTDCFLGKEDRYIIEREDNYVDIGSLKTYFTSYENWGEIEKMMPAFVSGKVLDVGCGAGRHSLHLQKLGFEVFAIDKSPGAIDLVRTMGVKNSKTISIDHLVQMNQPHFGLFDSIIMMGHNLGLLHSFDEGKKILSKLYEFTTANARIIGTTADATDTNNPYHLNYHQYNLKRGRMRGQIKLRIRYKSFVSDWLDYLFMTEKELGEIAKGTGWKIEKTLKGNAGFKSSSYLAILCKE